MEIIDRIENNGKDEDKTIKYLFRSDDGNTFEGILIFEDGLTLCTSSQIGCPVGCKFCMTGLEKFQRNLTSSEIIEQVTLVEDDIGKKIETVSYMGMGEPLLNIKNVRKSMKIFDKLGKKIKLSTTGVNGNGLDMFDIGFDLYFSLHAPDSDKRNEIIPTTNVIGLQNIIDSINNFCKKHKNSVTIWYLLLNGFNDTKHDLKKLITTLKMFNSIKLVYIKEYCETGTGFKTANKKKFDMFFNGLKKAGFPVKLSVSEGQKYYAGCGQLKQSRGI